MLLLTKDYELEALVADALSRIGAISHLVHDAGEALLDEHGKVTVANVPSYRSASQVSVEVKGHGPVVGDVAWGGNWFFLVNEHGQDIAFHNLEALTDFTWRIRQELTRQGITGAGGGEIDHIELFGPPRDPANNSRNFVLCPGKAYDRSPCGTGTSAKIACLAADGKLKPGEIWRQESIISSVFEASYRLQDGQCIPRISGTAYVNSEATLLLDPRDPFQMGIRT